MRGEEREGVGEGGVGGGRRRTGRHGHGRGRGRGCGCGQRHGHGRECSEACTTTQALQRLALVPKTKTPKILNVVYKNSRPFNSLSVAARSSPIAARLSSVAV